MVKALDCRPQEDSPVLQRGSLLFHCARIRPRNHRGGSPHTSSALFISRRQTPRNAGICNAPLSVHPCISGSGNEDFHRSSPAPGASLLQLDPAFSRHEANRELGTGTGYSGGRVWSVSPGMGVQADVLRKLDRRGLPTRLPQSPVPSPQSPVPVPSPQSPVPSPQSPVPSPQSPVPSPQSPVPSPQHSGGRPVASTQHGSGHIPNRHCPQSLYPCGFAAMLSRMLRVGICLTFVGW